MTFWFVVAGVAFAALVVLGWRHVAALVHLRRALHRLACGEPSMPLLADLPGGWQSVGRDLRAVAARMADLDRTASRERFGLDAVLGTIGEGVLIVDGGMRIRLSNRGAERLFDLGESPTGRTVMEAFRNLEIQRLVQQGISGGLPQRGEVPVDGGKSPKVFELNVSPLPMEDARIGAVVVVHDISRIKGLERVRREFVANVSHELRTPLTIISGYLETLIEGGMEDARTTETALQVMFKHADRLQHLVDDLLIISQAESRAVPLDLQQIDLCGLVRRVIEQFDGPVRSQGAEVRIVSASDSLPCTGDAVRLEQVFLNLLENALKYGNRPGLTVTFRIGRSGPDVQVEVSDNGPGIPHEDQEHIFERFYRVHKHRSGDSGGTGLGLSIVKNVVAAHGGTVSVTSTPGEGSTFLVAWPANTASPGGAE